MDKLKYYGWDNALLVYEDTPSKLVGKLLTLAESWGLPEKQEQSVKEMIRQEVYRSFDTAWILGDETHYQLRKKAYNFGQRSIGGYMPEDADAKLHYAGGVPFAIGADSSEGADRT